MSFDFTGNIIPELKYNLTLDFAIHFIEVWNREDLIWTLFVSVQGRIQDFYESEILGDFFTHMIHVGSQSSVILT
jgi:hypothetical protein